MFSLQQSKDFLVFHNFEGHGMWAPIRNIFANKIFFKSKVAIRVHPEECRGNKREWKLAGFSTKK